MSIELGKQVSNAVKEWAERNGIKAATTLEELKTAAMDAAQKAAEKGGDILHEVTQAIKRTADDLKLEVEARKGKVPANVVDEPARPPIRTSSAMPVILDTIWKENNTSITVKFHNKPVPDMSFQETITFNGEAGFFETQRNSFLGGEHDVASHPMTDEEKVTALQQLSDMAKTAQGEAKVLLNELITALQRNLTLRG